MTETPHGAAQRAHYNDMLEEYDAEYGDDASLEYRSRFFLAPLLEDMDLSGLDVADLAAGSGHTTLELKARFPTVRPMGFDISEHAVETYMTKTGCQAEVWDLTGNTLPERRFDAAVVVGGLHHCARDIGSALANVARLLKPGGVLLMVEPNRDTWLEAARQFWYRHDRLFEPSTESALSHDDLLRYGSAWFDCEAVRYMGGLAYFFVYNSLVFRVPRKLKDLTARPLMAVESLTNRLPGRSLYPYFIARWRLRAAQ